MPYRNINHWFSVTDLCEKQILYSTPKELKNPQILRDYKCWNQNSTTGMLLLKQSISSLFRENYVIIDTNCPLFALITHNKDNYRSLVKLKLIPDIQFEKANQIEVGFNLLSLIVRKHITFNKQLYNLVNNNRKQWRNLDCFGIHIRMGDSTSDFKEKRRFIYNSSLPLFTKCPIYQKMKHFAIYISSDSQNAKNSFIKSANNSNIFFSKNKACHTKERQFDKDLKCINDTLVELLTLSSCKGLIGTYGSTFSILAAALIGKLPYLVPRNSTCMLATNWFYI